MLFSSVFSYLAAYYHFFKSYHRFKLWNVLKMFLNLFRTMIPCIRILKLYKEIFFLCSFIVPSSLTLCNTKSQELRWNLWWCCGSAAALVGVWTWSVVAEWKRNKREKGEGKRRDIEAETPWPGVPGLQCPLICQGPTPEAMWQQSLPWSMCQGSIFILIIISFDLLSV